VLEFLNNLWGLGEPSRNKVVIPASQRRYFKLKRSPRIDSREPIPPAYVAWRAGTTTLFLLDS
jgi:hypothetical protein